MPARKPQGLKARHDTEAEKAARIAAEESMTPKRELPENPAQLKGHKIAASAYRRLRRIYESLEARIVNAMDFDTMIDLCMGIEELAELSEMRDKSREMEELFHQAYELARTDGTVKDIIAMAKVISAEKDRMLKIDARLDQKKKLLHTLRQSLYLTPRSRAATNPNKKEKEAPVDPFENLLDDVPAFLANGSRDDIA